jgi:DNA-binding response OmpR family regulator
MHGETRKGTRVLVVDDDADMRTSLQMILEAKGFEVEGAATGARALKAQRERPAPVVIIDLLMPEMDGIEAIVHLRKEYPGLKIIAMSGRGMRVKGLDYLGIAREIGADEMLRKPFEPDDLLAMLDNLTSASSDRP